METGVIFNIQKFCINDGPGIRTNVFFKGCPLHCIWCHNPESQKAQRQVMYRKDKCVQCRRCELLCPNHCHSFEADKHLFDRSKCTACGACTQAHCTALEVVGKTATVEEVLKEVLKDKPFYDNSGGGITLSGGEPLAQPEFALALLKRSKESGLHTCMETCGFTSEEVITKIAEYVDLFLYDYKEVDPVRHKEYTGVDNSVPLRNLFLLDKMGKQTVLRCPIIPGCNDREEHFAGIAETANRLKHVQKIEIEPYHALGESKRAALGEEEHSFARSIPDETVKEWIAKIQEKTTVAVSKG